MPRQISVPSTLPKINLKLGRGPLYVLGSVLLVLAVIAVLGRLRNQPPEVLPNALWIGTEWTYDAYTEEQLQALVQRLRDNKIGTVYAWVSYLQDDGTWRQETTGAWDNVKVFRERLKALYPEVAVYGWVSLNVNLGDGNQLDEPEVIDAVVNLSGRVITEFAFDGVYLNVEPVWDNDQNFLELLRKVRAQVGTDVPVGGGDSARLDARSAWISPSRRSLRPVRSGVRNTSRMSRCWSINCWSWPITARWVPPPIIRAGSPIRSRCTPRRSPNETSTPKSSSVSRRMTPNCRGMIR